MNESDLNQKVIDYLKVHGPTRTWTVINNVCGPDALRFDLKKRIHAMREAGIIVKVRAFVIGLREGW